MRVYHITKAQAAHASHASYVVIHTHTQTTTHNRADTSTIVHARVLYVLDRVTDFRIAMASGCSCCSSDVHCGGENLRVSSPQTECTVVFVPSDTSEKVREWKVSIAAGEEVECVVKTAREHYSAQSVTKRGQTRRGSDEEDENDAKEAYKKQLKAHVASTGRDNAGDVSEAMLNAAAEMQLVETLALLPGGLKTNFIHVNMYCDDRAVSKGSPVNERATGIATACGLTAQVRGDVFIGRVLEDDERFERLEFTSKDLDSSSAWVTLAKSINVERHAGAAAGGSGADMLAQMQAMAGPDATVVGNTGMTQTQMKMPPSEAMLLPQQGHNGKYTWSQTEDEVVVELTCPETTTRKDVRCKFGQQSITLSVDTIEGDDKIVVEGKLFQKIDVDGSTWTMGAFIIRF